jgi:hypothetical protein
MPPQDPNSTKKPILSKDKSSADPDKEMREDWEKLSKSDQDSYFASLGSEKEQDAFATRVGMFGPVEGHTVRAPLKPSVPWLKEKAYRTLNWGLNQIPTVTGAAGGIVGGALGEAVDVAGGGIAGAPIGAGVGGAGGEAVRKFLVKKLGMDPYAKPKSKTETFKDIAKEGAYQAAGELIGMGAGKILRPTLERSLAKAYYAGNLKYGDPRGPGELETVFDDLLDAESKRKSPKFGGNKGNAATTVGDFLAEVSSLKKEIGQQVDLQYALPIQQNGQTVMLGQAHADSTAIVAAIQAKALDSPSVTKMAAVRPSGKEAVYLAKIKDEALAFQQHPWTYGELNDRRIHLNQELAPLYSLPSGEQRVYLLEHPELAFKKAEAEAIRDTVYPVMDKLANNPPGTTLAMQNKRGALMSLETQIEEHLGTLKTKARVTKGAPPLDKTNISTYGTSSGKPGFGVHRLQGLVHTPNPERKADKQVARAFGNTLGEKFRKSITKPFDMNKLGDEILAMPIREFREYMKDDTPTPPPSPDDDPGPDAKAVRPKDLIEKAKQMNPPAQGQVAYTHNAVHEQNGHRIGSHDGVNWEDAETGEKVA